MAMKPDISTADGPAAVEARLKQLYGKVSIEAESIALQDRSAVDERFAVNRMEFRGEFAVEAENVGITVGVSASDARWRIGDEEGSLTVPTLTRPGVLFEGRIENLDLEAVTFDRESLLRFARSLYAEDGLQLVFARSTPTPAGLATARAAIEFAIANRQAAIDSELISASMYYHLAVCVLESFPLAGDPEARTASARAGLAGYRRARSFIDDFASLPITVADIATAASLSSDQLSSVFHTHSLSGRDAAAELRRVRLDAAHRDLVAADPTLGDTVAQIALRWGFSPGHFAQQYRAVYGRNPKWVLDR